MKIFHVVHYQNGLIVGASSSECSYHAKEDILFYCEDTVQTDGLDWYGDDIYLEDFFQPCTLIDQWERYLDREELALMTIAASEDMKVTLEITNRDRS